MSASVFTTWGCRRFSSLFLYIYISKVITLVDTTKLIFLVGDMA